MNFFLEGLFDVEVFLFFQLEFSLLLESEIVIFFGLIFLWLRGVFGIQALVEFFFFFVLLYFKDFFNVIFNEPLSPETEFRVAFFVFAPVGAIGSGEILFFLLGDLDWVRVLAFILIDAVPRILHSYGGCLVYR